MTTTHKISLRATNEEGSFICPHCGFLISPDDESDETYFIFDTKTNDDALKEVTMLCRCGAIITLSLQ